mgnify:CR=1 FL=1
MPLRRAEKIQLTDDYQKMVEDSQALLVFDYLGLNVEQFTELRRKVRESEGNIKVVKNRMLKRAIADKPYSGPMDEHLVGPSAVLFTTGEDPVKPTKTLVDYIKDHEDLLQIKCGMFNDGYLDSAQVEELAKTPPIEQLHAKILGGIKAPASNLLGLFKGSHQKLHGLFTAYAQKLEEAS